MEIIIAEYISRVNCQIYVIFNLDGVGNSQLGAWSFTPVYLGVL